MPEYAKNFPHIIGICGTDTDVGKTVVTAGLLRAGLDLYPALEIQALKAVQTGCLPGSAGTTLLAPDVQIYQEVAPEVKSLALFTLPEACSPHLAAGRSGTSLSAEIIARAVLTKAVSAGTVRGGTTLLELAGGLFTPLNSGETMLDILQFLHNSGCCSLKVILVTANKLGAINQALLSLAAIRSRNLEIAGFISSCPTQPRSEAVELATAIAQDNIQSISSFGKVACLAELPYLPDLNRAGALAAKQKAWKKLARILAVPAEQLFARQKDAPMPTEQVLPVARQSAGALFEFDRKHLWHPYAPAVPEANRWEAYKTEGSCIWLRDLAVPVNVSAILKEYKVVDGISSWWSAVHGYNHPDILKALRAQADLMPHVMFGGFTHAPAVNLGKKLLTLVPDALQHVFFVDSGSVAVEVALKMAAQYQLACGNSEKSGILTVCGGYHGDTLGAMSVCDPANGMHASFKAILPKQFFAPRPECRFDRPYSPESFEALERVFNECKQKIAAVILEPVFQGAGGMWFYHPEYLMQLKTLCAEHNTLLILDEIATGFGRTGRMFASEWAGVQPDIMCVGKALTGGAVTLAATLCSRHVAGMISQNGGRLMHGPTFMANPLACAVALASLELLTSSPWKQRVEKIESLLHSGLDACAELPGVEDVRVLGAIGVVEMKKEINSSALQEFFVRECGVWIRPFGKLIYLMPPYVVSEQELQKLTLAVCRAVKDFA
ncbi:MAG: adenosylmethionine--8-amino-7-oxononanoate transaminase [Deltaproteobacteria bacterium]|jgi:adenosylmethionine-8-amino-7-oxononanoate aminotransferase|nr:adenosylmethionine--8-amino-7-oxononanoate transaminase [Deltaproteobacteria bacterium]